MGSHPFAEHDLAQSFIASHFWIISSSMVPAGDFCLMIPCKWLNSYPRFCWHVGFWTRVFGGCCPCVMERLIGDVAKNLTARISLPHPTWHCFRFGISFERKFADP